MSQIMTLINDHFEKTHGISASSIDRGINLWVPSRIARRGTISIAVLDGSTLQIVTHYSGAKDLALREVDRRRVDLSDRSSDFLGVASEMYTALQSLVVGTLSDDGDILLDCPKGGKCLWRIDGAHSNVFCGKCFGSHPSG